MPLTHRLDSNVDVYAQGATMMPINWNRAILAGIAATIVFDLIGLLLGGTWWQVPRLLSSAKLGAPLPFGVAAITPTV
jgi:hypothetical protein